MCPYTQLIALTLVAVGILFSVKLSHVVEVDTNKE